MSTIVLDRVPRNFGSVFAGFAGHNAPIQLVSLKAQRRLRRIQNIFCDGTQASAATVLERVQGGPREA